ncbi:hypothetical protein FIBSPDRAFT_875798 [Athelia psychrophila]|uniref:Uncharacterized protein n=1 Tax=Athelia psychrophila TaxID=1759441 RepID=A0A167XGY4_9AGAM|nr:hypothetical protein FIBSPDRAFT_875798 [Fibularhizoctonia sp. CBS 109695]
MASQLPSPPETLTESLANSQSTPGSSTDRLQTIYPAKKSFGPSIPFDPQSWQGPTAPPRYVEDVRACGGSSPGSRVQGNAGVHPGDGARRSGS